MRRSGDLGQDRLAAFPHEKHSDRQNQLVCRFQVTSQRLPCVFIDNPVIVADPK